jgi:peptide/nickel transport system ATP-binding protein
MIEPLLSIRGLCVDYVGGDGPVRAVADVSLDLGRGEVLGIAGESGCGKSTLAQAVLRILPPPAIVSGGQALFEGQDIMRLSEDALRALRWRRISMVFQSAMDALNPVLTVGEQLHDTLTTHGVAPKAARSRAAELFEMVGIPASRLRSYPHQLSGGMRQRVGIALALALSPALVILDEPTTALDVIVEREILQQLVALKNELGFSVMFITHDLSRMLEVSDRVAIFYSGRLVELAPAQALRTAPRHPYTQNLFRAFPKVHGGSVTLSSIPGSPPSLRSPPPGCRFHPRCEQAVDACREREPPLLALGGGHEAACHLLDARGEATR